MDWFRSVNNKIITHHYIDMGSYKVLDITKEPEERRSKIEMSAMTFGGYNKLCIIDHSYESFVDEFTRYWCYMNNTDVYRKNDLHMAHLIDNYEEATKLIPVLWSLAENDHYVKYSDKSMTIFVKYFRNGRLSSLYKSTSTYYREKQLQEALDGIW